MNKAAHAALTRWRKHTQAVRGWVCRSTWKPQQPSFTSVSRDWLREAERLAELPHMPRGGWHTFRRGWATARRYIALQDVAKTEGWRNSATTLQCYQLTTAEDTKAAATFVA